MELSMKQAGFCYFTASILTVLSYFNRTMMMLYWSLLLIISIAFTFGGVE